MILLILMNIFPLIYSLYLSFTNYSVISDKAPEWVGLQNYITILSDNRFWQNFAVTGRYALISGEQFVHNLKDFQFADRAFTINLHDVGRFPREQMPNPVRDGL